MEYHLVHKKHKFFNKNKVTISYSCMKNIGFINSAHNRNILNPIVQSYGCNCSVKSSCPINHECLTPKIIYTEPIFVMMKTATKSFPSV